MVGGVGGGGVAGRGGVPPHPQGIPTRIRRQPFPKWIRSTGLNRRSPADTAEIVVRYSFRPGTNWTNNEIRFVRTERIERITKFVQFVPAHERITNFVIRSVRTERITKFVRGPERIERNSLTKFVIVPERIRNSLTDFVIVPERINEFR